jgi:cell division protein YceG involved in septum cleavage
MKATNIKFPMASSAHRIAIVSGLISGLVGRAEAMRTIEQDAGQRRHKKPVVAEGVQYDSVTDAAKFLVLVRPGRLSKEAFFRAVQNEQKRIARLCNQDQTEGYYWAE